jgi:hypothetical protein
MDALFDPLNLDNRVSLNRTVLADHRAVDRRVRGKQAWDLLSSQALRRQIEARAKSLRLDSAELQASDPVRLLDECLASNEPGVRVNAALLVNGMGRYLAYLLMTLTKFGSGWPPADNAYLEHWTTIRTVWLGGGIVQGRLGRRMQGMCRWTLDHEGFRGLKVELAQQPQLLPLVGAARSVSAGDTALVFDFGSTNVKHGIASFRDGAVVRLSLEPPIATDGLPDELSGTSDLTAVQRLANFMTSVMCDDWREAVAAGRVPCNQIVVSIACYVRDGQPLAYDAGYASLRLLSDNAAHYLSQAVSAAVGSEVNVSLAHDGTTAARVVAGQPRTAVIMLGTWLGVGFAPEDASGLRPLAPAFEVLDK